MPQNEIKVNLVADLNLYLNKLGIKGSIEDAFKQQPRLTRAIAGGLGLNIQEVIAQSISKGVKQGAEKAKGSFPYAAFLNQSLGIGSGQNRPNKNAYEAFWKPLSSTQNLAAFLNQSLGIGAASQGKSQQYFNEVFGKRAPQNIAAFLNQQLGIGAGQNTPNRKNYEDFWKTAVPPFAKPGPSNIFAKLESLFSGSTGLLGGFGRYEVGQAFMHSIGAGGGVAGRLGGTAFTQFGAKVPGATVALAALTIAIEGTKIALRSLISAAEEGAKLYIQSRHLGYSTSGTASLNSLAIAGLSQGRMGEISRFLPNNFNGNMGQLLGASRISGGSIQEQQAILNLSQEIKEIWVQTRDAAVFTANAARANFSIVKELAVVRTKLDTTKQLASSFFEPIIYGLARTFDKFLDYLNSILDGYLRIAQYLHIIPGAGVNPSRIIPFQRETHFSSLERMGLVIGGQHDRVFTVLQAIERNTRPRNNGSGGALPSNRYPQADRPTSGQIFESLFGSPGVNII